MERLRSIPDRRLPALLVLLGAWALLVLACARAGERARGWALRVGASAILWAPAASLITAALMPGAAGEYAILTLSCFALAAAGERLLPWPRAPIAPAVVAVLAITLDSLSGTQLLMRSLLGPDPLGGARFYGIGNELKPALAVLALGAVAAALYPCERGRRAVSAMAGTGALLAVVEGAGRIGAGVGGVVLVSTSFAVASVMLAPSAGWRRRGAIVLLSPFVGLAALAAIDLATAHGVGHFTGTVLHARSPGELREVLIRRYTAAWDALKTPLTALATVLAAALTAAWLQRADRLLEPVDGDPAWRAALAGGVTAGVVGTLVEDSGPLLLLVATFTLGCLLAYLQGAPPPAPSGRSAPPIARARERDLVP